MRTTNETVASGADFIELLHQLAEGLGPEAPTVDDFLLRWAGTLPSHNLRDPGWPGLARQVLAALAAPPTGGAMPAYEKLTDEPEVRTSDGLRALLEALAADYVRDRQAVADAVAEKGPGWWDSGDWAHGSLSEVLGTWAVWLKAVLGRSRRFSGPPIEPVTWASIAEQLLAARIYE